MGNYPYPDRGGFVVSYLLTRIGMRIEVITSIGELEQLGPEWWELWRRCPFATPFQSPAWAISWCRHIGHPQLRTLALRDQGRLAGLAPFFLWRDPAAGETVLLLAGTGISDYLDVLIPPEHESAGPALIFDWLLSERRGWEVCDWHQLRPESPLLRYLSPVDWREETQAQEACPVLSLPASLEQWAGSGPSGLLQQARYAWRGAEQLGTPRFERADDANFETLFSALVRLHEARWRARRGAGMLAEKEVQEFHREAARGLLAAGALRLYGLRLNDQWAASFYGFQQAGRAYYYLGGFDPALGPLSLGTLMVSHAIEAAIREGAREFDFLRGSEGYKYRWGARDRATYRRTLRVRPAPHPEQLESIGRAAG